MEGDCLCSPRLQCQMLGEKKEKTRTPLQYFDFRARNKSVLPHITMQVATLPRHSNVAVKCVRVCGVVSVNRTSFKRAIRSRN